MEANRLFFELAVDEQAEIAKTWPGPPHPIDGALYDWWTSLAEPIRDDIVAAWAERERQDLRERTEKETRTRWRFAVGATSIAIWAIVS